MNTSSRNYPGNLTRPLKGSWSFAPLCLALLLFGAVATRAASLTVTNTADSGDGSLRATIAAASNGDTIAFSLPSPSTITLTSGGLLISNLTLTIAGPGTNSLAISGNGTNTVFSIISNSVVILSGMTITNGGGGIYASGTATTVIVSNVVASGNSSETYGAIRSQSSNFRIVDSVVSGNSSIYGGAIYAFFGVTSISNVLVISNLATGISCLSGELEINDTRIIGNSALSGNGDGGGLALQAEMEACTLAATNVTISGNWATNGGGMYFTAGLGNFYTYVSHITIVGNQAVGGGGGIEAYEAGALTFNNCVISSNMAGGGGAISAYHTDTILTDVSLVGNTATGYGGAINSGSAAFELNNATVVGNSSGAGGGAICSSSGGAGVHASVSFYNCLIASNTAASGGVIFEEPDTYGVDSEFFNCTVAYNMATNYGGAIYNFTAGGGSIITIVGSTFNDNVATVGGGGAIYSFVVPNDFPGTSWIGITNSTFSGNSAGTGGGIYNECDASLGPFGNYGATNSSAGIAILNSTFTGNSATNGGTLFNMNAGVGTTPVQIGSSIFNAGTFGRTILNFAGVISSLGYNLSSDNAGGALTNSTDLINIDPQLGPLQNNGGTVQTHALMPSSPAVDKGKNFSGSLWDERGPYYTRTYDYPSVPNAGGGDGTDIGAYELETFFDPFVIWQFQNFGCTNCPQAAPTADPDGDGADNMAEFLAGTNPNNPSSAFRVLAVTRQGNDLLVKWQTAGGHTNVLQSSSTLAQGSFSDISSNIVIPGTGDATNTYLEIGAALNGTNSYYRVRLGP
jgi:predicted outer membrane repeat protein